MKVLERLFLVRVRRPWHVNLGSRQVKAPKLYVSDTGLLGALVGADVSRVRDDDFAGALFETFVATELERQAHIAVRRTHLGNPTAGAVGNLTTVTVRRGGARCGAARCPRCK